MFLSIPVNDLNKRKDKSGRMSKVLFNFNKKGE